MGIVFWVCNYERLEISNLTATWHLDFGNITDTSVWLCRSNGFLKMR